MKIIERIREIAKTCNSGIFKSTLQHSIDDMKASKTIDELNQSYGKAVGVSVLGYNLDLISPINHRDNLSKIQKIYTCMTNEIRYEHGMKLTAEESEQK